MTTIVYHTFSFRTSLIDDFCYSFSLDPLIAACLNARYLELTGKNHPNFLRVQGQVLDEIMRTQICIGFNGKPSIYQRLKNNLTNDGLGIKILLSEKGSYIEKYEKIKYDIGKASLEDVKEILDNYDQDSVLINGMQYHFRPNVLEGASLNARYFELTGHNHPVFVRVQKELLQEKIEEGEGISFNGNPSVYEDLLNNNLEIGNSNHVVNRFYSIINDLENARVEDIYALLNYYNGKSVIIDGIAHTPFNDPVTADKLNTRYFELTGENHPNFLIQVPIVIDWLMRDKEELLAAKAYDISYFNKLEEIKEKIDMIKEEKETKRLF